MEKLLTLAEAAEAVGKSKETLRRWDREGKLTALREPVSNYRVYRKEDVLSLFSEWMDEEDFNPPSTDNLAIPGREYGVLELFAGAGGLAVGLEQAGLKCVVLNEIDKWAC